MLHFQKEQTGDIITFTWFEEGGLLSETWEDAESGDKSNDNSIMPPLLSEEEMDAIDSGDESDYEPMSTEMLEDICDRSQSHPNASRIEACYRIHYHSNKRQLKWKRALKVTRKTGKGLYKVFKTVVKNISQYLPPFSESCS